MNSQNIPRILFCDAPQNNPVPLVLDSPHSGTDYPEDFKHSSEMMVLRRAEDTYIHELYADAPSLGATLIGAHFPRSYIDVNRALHEMDLALLEDAWTHPVEPSEKTELGIGLIWRKNQFNEDIYNRRLSISEVEARIENYWRPYHQTLQAVLDEKYASFGRVWHLNCHSMPEMSNETSKEGPGIRRPEFCLGDRRGTTCDPAFVDRTREILEDLGYSVAVNEPYAGVELVRAYSDPDQGRHSLQVEIRRDLYMDEESFEKTAHFAQLKSDLKILVEKLAAFSLEH